MWPDDTCCKECRLAKRLTVPPIPSHVFFPWLVAKKVHDALIPSHFHGAVDLSDFWNFCTVTQLHQRSILSHLFLDAWLSNPLEPLFERHVQQCCCGPYDHLSHNSWHGLWWCTQRKDAELPGHWPSDTLVSHPELRKNSFQQSLGNGSLQRCASTNASTSKGTLW